MALVKMADRKRGERRKAAGNAASFPTSLEKEGRGKCFVGKDLPFAFINDLKKKVYLKQIYF